MIRPLLRCALISASLFSIGCSHVDYSTQPQFEHQMGSCYELLRESFVIDSYCEISVNGELESVDCLGIQSFEPDPVRSSKYKKPLSWADYQSDKEHWDKIMFDKGENPVGFLFPANKRSLEGRIAQGTRLEIAAIYGRARGETGHILAVSAKVLDGEYRSRYVMLPGVAVWNLPPIWLGGWFHREGQPVNFHDYYLKSCE